MYMLISCFVAFLRLFFFCLLLPSDYVLGVRAALFVVFLWRKRGWGRGGGTGERDYDLRVGDHVGLWRGVHFFVILQ